ncbi:unnamed protein product [Calypogeia fissa]
MASIGVLRLKKPNVVTASLLLVMSLLMTARAQTIFDIDFCNNWQQPTTCPTPPTFDLVNLQAMSGKWYEIGTNAKFKLFRENGMACNSANYTAVSTPPNFWGVTQSNLSIVDTGVKAMGPLSGYGVAQVSLASKGLCTNARTICSLMTSDSQLGQAVTQLATSSGQLLLLHPIEAAQLINASASVGAAINSINAALDALTRSVTSIQYINAQLSQVNGSVQTNLQQLTNVTTQATLVQSTIQQAVSSIAAAKGIVMEVTAKMLFAGGIVPMTIVPDLGKVTYLLASAELAIIVQAGEMELSLFGINAMTPLISIDNSKPVTLSSTGSAMQNNTAAGSLSAHIHGVEAPLLILAVNGLASAGYTSALLYSCVEVPNGQYQQGLFIISRTPTLDPIVVSSLLGVASFNGIQTSCDDPFVYTVQQSPICT